MAGSAMSDEPRTTESDDTREAVRLLTSELKSWREESKATTTLLADEMIGLRGFVERLAMSNERSTNIAEACSERTLQVLSTYTQIESAQKITIMAVGQIRELEEKNRAALEELRAEMARHGAELAAMKEELFVAIGRAAEAEETSQAARDIALEAKKTAIASQALKRDVDEAKKHAFTATREAQAVKRDLEKISEDVEELDDRVDTVTDKRVAELEQHRQKSETDLREEARKGQELAATLVKSRLDEERSKLAIEQESARARWAIIGRVLAPAVLLALISLAITLASKCGP